MEDKNKSKKYKIKIDRNLCIGAASCVALAMKTFALDSENKAVILEEDGDDAGAINGRTRAGTPGKRRVFKGHCFWRKRRRGYGHRIFGGNFREYRQSRCGGYCRNFNNRCRFGLN